MEAIMQMFSSTAASLSATENMLFQPRGILNEEKLMFFNYLTQVSHYN